MSSTDEIDSEYWAQHSKSQNQSYHKISLILSFTRTSINITKRWDWFCSDYKHTKYRIQEPEPWQKTTLKFNQQEHPLLGPKQESELHHLLFCPIPEKILVKLDLPTADVTQSSFHTDANVVLRFMQVTKATRKAFMTDSCRELQSAYMCLSSHHIPVFKRRRVTGQGQIDLHFIIYQHVHEFVHMLVLWCYHTFDHHNMNKS